MIQHSIKNVKSPVNKFDAVNKAYTDRIKYKSATGTIENDNVYCINQSKTEVQIQVIIKCSQLHSLSIL